MEDSDLGKGLRASFFARLARAPRIELVLWAVLSVLAVAWFAVTGDASP